MAETPLSAGVFIEEEPSSPQIISSVTTSNYSTAGFFKKGPVNEATLVTSINDITRKFGPLDENQPFTGLSLYGFFRNGGVRAYVVRVVPADAVTADLEIQSSIYNQEFETGDHSTDSFVGTAATSLLQDNDGASPLVASSFNMRWRGFTSAVTDNNLVGRDEATEAALVTSQAGYELRFDPKAKNTLPGLGDDDQDIYYRSVGDGRKDITITYTDPGGPTSLLAITVTGTAIDVSLETDGGSSIISTAADVQTALAADASVGNLVTAVLVGDGSTVLAAMGATALVGGTPAFDPELMRVVPSGSGGAGTIIKISWDPDAGGDRTIDIPADTPVTALSKDYYVLRAVAKANLVDDESFVVGDGTNSITFEFDDDATTTIPGSTAIDLTALTTANDVADAVASAINSSSLSIAATVTTASSDHVVLTHTSGGAITMTEAVADTGFVVGTRLKVDYSSGFLSLLTAGTDIPVGGGNGNPIRANFVASAGPFPTGASADVDAFTASDDGAGQIVSPDGALSGLAGTASASITEGDSGNIRLTVLETVNALYVGASVTIFGAATAAYNATGTVTQVVDDNNFDVDITWTVNDPNNGAISYTISTGTLDYSTGAFVFETTAGAVSSGGATPHGEAAILATYDVDAWHLDASSQGVWANDMRMVVAGNIDNFDAATNSYSLFDVEVQEKNETLSTASNTVWSTSETYEALDMSDATSASYFADVLNELSDLVVVSEPAGDMAPGQLNGQVRTEVIAGGSGLTTGNSISLSLGAPAVAERSVSISYYVGGVEKTVTDSPNNDGTGTLIGDVASGTNSITYANGSLDVTLAPSSSIDAGSLVVVTYATNREEASHAERFGDTAKGFTAGTDGTFDASNYGRSQFTDPALEADEEGIYALNAIEELMQVALPDFAGDFTIDGDLLDYAESRTTLPSGGDRFIILTTPVGSTAQEAVDYTRFTLNRYSIWGAMYWPHVKVADPFRAGRSMVMPPVGHVAGVYARTDRVRNVGKAPGGTVDGVLNFITGLETKVTQAKRDVVYPNRINPLRDDTQAGKCIWGVRTMASPSQSEWKYINARRLFMFLEKSIFNSTHWIVFENNGPALWAKIASQLNGFLSSQFTNGLFAGSTPAQAYFVIVDSTNNTVESINQGQVIIDVGAAPNRPAEFVRFRFSQKSLEV